MSAILVPLLAGCGGAAPATSPGEPVPDRPTDFARPTQIYRQLGLSAGPDDFPVVASTATLAGAGDSTLVLFGLSLPASALRFRREDDAGFSAEYVVALRFVRDSELVRMVDRRETVRVPEFAATARTDETVVFQTAVHLLPGDYELEIRIRDGLSARGFETTRPLRVPSYGDDRLLAAPLPVYRSSIRAGRDAAPDLIMNPRHTVPYGGVPPAVYLEAYGTASVRLEVLDETGERVWARDVELAAAEGLAAGSVALPVDSLPLGRFWLRSVAGDEVSPRVPLLVTISDQWLVANFEEVLEFLRYIAPPDELDSLRAAGPESRRERWEAFWSERDPVPATPGNEYREAFFDRIRTATEQFSESGRPGWRTDRGEVFIVLGPPTEIVERNVNGGAVVGEPAAQEWVYLRVPGGGGLHLVFVDRSGFGTYRLTPGSEAEFRAVARRMRRSHDR